MTDRYSTELEMMLAEQWWARKALALHAPLFALAQAAGDAWRGEHRPSVLWVDAWHAAGKGVLLTIEVGDGDSLKDVEPVLEVILDRGLVAKKTIEDVTDFWAWRQWPFAEQRRKLPAHPIVHWHGWERPMIHVRANVKPGAVCVVKVETSYNPGTGKLLCPGDPGYDEELSRREVAQ